jgi:hypothetical protein
MLVKEGGFVRVYQEGCLAKNVWIAPECVLESMRCIVEALVQHSGFWPVVALARRVSVSCRRSSGATAAGRRSQPIPGMECVASRPTRVVILSFGARSSTCVAESCIRECARGTGRHAIPALRNSGFRRSLCGQPPQRSAENA